MVCRAAYRQGQHAATSSDAAEISVEWFLHIWANRGTPFRRCKYYVEQAANVAM